MDLAAHLRDRTPFRRLHRVRSCDSTQSLSEAATDSDWSVFWAEHQRAGRGRQGRSWNDDEGRDLALTFRVTGLPLPDPTRLAATVPVAVANALDPLVAGIAIKWPNDLLHGGRKLCGILIDTGGQPPHTFHIGVGINVNRTRFPAELVESSTSLALLSGVEHDRERLVAGLAESLADALHDLRDGNVDRLTQSFRSRFGLVGQRVFARTGTREFEDVLTDIDLDRASFAVAEPIPLAHLLGLRRT